MNNALIKVSNHFDSKFTDYQKDRMSKLSVIGNPSNNLILIDISKLNPGDNVDGLIYVDSINSDPVYNRILDVTVNNVIGRVENKNGFSYSDCGNIKVYVRPGGIIVTTQGNHRTLMKIGVDGNNSTIPAKIIVHKDGLTLQVYPKQHFRSFDISDNYLYTLTTPPSACFVLGPLTRKESGSRPYCSRAVSSLNSISNLSSKLSISTAFCCIVCLFIFNFFLSYLVLCINSFQFGTKISKRL